MAQKVNIILVDDLDGSEANETVTFGLDGNQYEIDLTTKHAEAMRKALAHYVEKGRKTAARRGRKPGPKPGAAPATDAPKARGGRKRTATVEQIEAGKS